MDGKSAGGLLSRAYPSDEDMKNMLDVLDGSPSILPASFLPPVMMLVPQTYVTRQHRQIDICGNVDVDTLEYDQGYRFYSSEAEFFFSDGKCSSNGDHAGDLIHLADTTTASSETISPYRWVHPQHLVIKAWFRNLVPGKVDLIAGNRYINRMGHVIELTSNSFFENDMTVYKDIDGRIYTAQGTVFNNSPSMFDLVYEIRHWQLFCEQDWANPKVVAKKQSEQQMMMMFDPTAEERRELMTKFFAAMSEVNRLADQLNIDLGFTMKTN